MPQKPKLIPLILLAPAALPWAAEPPPGTDFYPSFEALRANEVEGVDYRIRGQSRPQPAGARILILAPHGGRIERATSELALQSAGSDWSYYVFEGLKQSGNQRLHLTSTRFDEPQALEAVQSHDWCVSLHGFREPDRDQICVGGNSPRARQALSQALHEAIPAIEVEEPCLRFPGAEANNIGNRCLQGGAQLEMSTHLRDSLLSDPARMKQVSDAIRTSLERLTRGGARPQPENAG